MLNEKNSAEYLYAVYDLLAYVVKYKANKQTINLLNNYINKLADYINDPTIDQSDVKAALNTFIIHVTKQRPSSIFSYFREKVSKISSDNNYSLRELDKPSKEQLYIAFNFLLDINYNLSNFDRDVVQRNLKSNRSKI